MTYKPYLSITFVWHPSDNKVVEESINYCQSALQRDKDKPFSRLINIPVFYRTSLDSNVPDELQYDVEKDIVFLFISKHVIANPKWTKYINEISETENCIVVPIAIDDKALNIEAEKLEKINFIRAYDFNKNYYQEELLLHILHESYRQALNENNEIIENKDKSAVKLFLSHCKKSDGVNIAKQIKHFIDNSTMDNFFDATDISIGDDFSKTIEENLQGSTLIAFHTDEYSTRYWCQREIQMAKELDRPIISVDCQNNFEDRRYPYASNIPSVHINCDEFSDNDKYKILIATLLETIRYYYSKKCLKIYQEQYDVLQDNLILSRPPEPFDINKILEYSDGGCNCVRKYKGFLYPEPRVYSEEVEWLKKLNISSITPLDVNEFSLSDKEIGISISDFEEPELVKLGQTKTHLKQLSQDIARQLLYRNAILAYGGDLRQDGFTEFLAVEATILKNRTKRKDILVKNYSAWPIYLKEEATDFRAEYSKVLELIEVGIPTDLPLNKETFIAPNTPENQYIWSRCLTQMREEMINNSDIKICAGGRGTGYKGKIPGVLEEILIAQEKKKPIFLLGGFGGITEKVCQWIFQEKKEEISKELTLEYQIRNNSGYGSLLDFAKKQGQLYDNVYDDLRQRLSYEMLSTNGLSEDENKILAKTPFIDQAIFLVLKGLKNIPNGQI